MKYFYAIILGLMVLVTACAQQVQTTQKTGDAMEDKGDAMVEAKPSIAVNDQPVKDGVVKATKVMFDKSGFVVIHKVVDGKPGSVIGNSDILQKGEFSNVEVSVTDYENENELIAMLHYDDGDSIYEFPGDDAPTTLDDKVVLTKFSLTEAQETKATSSSEVRVLGDGAFDPDALTINVGDSVTWINTDDREAVIIIFKDGRTYMNSQKFDPGEQFENEFMEAGSYQYWRNIAFSSDGGMITVE